jgi:hypothetical protein
LLSLINGNYSGSRYAVSNIRNNIITEALWSHWQSSTDASQCGTDILTQCQQSQVGAVATRCMVQTSFNSNDIRHQEEAGSNEIKDSITTTKQNCASFEPRLFSKWSH